MIKKLALFFSVFLCAISYASTPTNLMVTDSTILSLTLNWDSVNNADSYKLYRSDSSGLSFVEVANPIQNTYKDSTLQQETKYFYKISSVINGVESALSDSVEGTTRFSNLKVFSIWVDSLDLDSLNSDLPESGKCCYKPATLNFEGGSFNVEVRYKGLTEDHWLYDMKSWRVKFDSQNLYGDGNKTLNFDNPGIKLIDENISYLLAKKMGLVIPNSEMVRMKINGKDQGVHFMYEHEREEEFFSVNNLPLGELYIEADESKKLNWFYKGDNSSDYYDEWEKSIDNVGVSNGDYSTLIELLKYINIVPNEFVIDSLNSVFNIDKFLDYYAHSMLSNTIHNDYHNLRLYLNPQTSLFEQWPNDPAAWQNGNYIPQDWCQNQLTYKVLQNPLIGFEKNKKLYEFANLFSGSVINNMVDSVWLKVNEDVFTDSLKDQSNGITYTYSQQIAWINQLKNDINSTSLGIVNYLEQCGVNYSQEILQVDSIEPSTIQTILGINFETLPNVASVINSITLSSQGSGNEFLDIDSVYVFKDVNQNDIIDFGDVLLSSPKNFISDNSQLTFTLNDTLFPNRETFYLDVVNQVGTNGLFSNTKNQIEIKKQNYSYLVGYKFNSNASSLNSYELFINSNSDILAQNAITSSQILPNFELAVNSVDDFKVTSGFYYSNQLKVPGATNFTLMISPNWLSITNEGLIYGTPSSSDVGSDSVIVNISDDFGNSIIHSYELTVFSQNSSPEIIFNTDLGNGSSGINRNGGLSFDGTNDYVSVPNSSLLDLENDFSIEIWFKPNFENENSDNTQLLYNKKHSLQIFYRPNNDNFVSSNLVIKTQNNGSVTGNYGINSQEILRGEWNQLVITYEDSILECYVNSKLRQVFSNVPNLGAPYSGDLYFGSFWTGSDYFHGKIDDIRIWNRVLNPEEIFYNYTYPGKFHSGLDLNTDIIANWTFSEGIGTTTFDQGPNGLGGTINGATWDNELYWKKNTYYITQDIRLDSTVSLTIEPGSTIKLADSSSFIFYGPLIADGTLEEPITFTRMSANGNWGTVGTNNPLAQGSVFDNILVEHGKDDTVDGQFYIGALSLYNIDADVTYSRFQYNKGDDGINYKYSNSDVIGCTFVNNFADNIDYDYTTGEIRDSYFLINEEGLDANGDGVDCGTANPYIHDNVFFNLGDKGISVGEQSFPIIKNNIIKGCYFGIACKDLSNPIIENNVIVDNHIAIASYRKKPAFGGADGQVKNCILWGNTFPDSIDIYSDLTITYSDVEGGYAGIGNFDSDPEFINPTILDYHLASTSPAIDAGDPTSDYSNEPEPNGFRVNLGRYGNTREAVTSTASTSQRVPLADGYNLISWGKNTTNDSITSVFETVLDSVDLITSFNQGALIYNPSLPNFSNLNEVSHYRGYWVNFNGVDTLVVEGSSVPTDEPNPLWIGWNLVSYFPDFEDSTQNAFASILDNSEMITGFENGALAYDPNLPQFSTLTITKPGLGYWVKLSTLDTLNYPLISSIPPTVSPSSNKVVSNIFTIEKQVETPKLIKKSETQRVITKSKGLEQTRRKAVAKSELKKVLSTSKKQATKISEVETIEIHPTNEWIFLYGENLTPNGFPLAVGSLVTATDQSGVVCGAWEVSEEGKFGFMPIYKDDSSTQLDEGMSQGEEILVYIDGVLAYNGITWDSFGEKVNLGSSVLSAEDSESLLPKEYSLAQNYPNPFNPTTNIKYALPTDSKVNLTIYNTLGQEVIKLVNNRQKAGFYEVSWNGLDKHNKPVSSGVYFYKIKADNFVKNKKMVFLK